MADVEALESLANTVMRMSRRGLGQTAPNPILTTMRNLPTAWGARLRPEAFLPQVAMRDALAEAIQVQRNQGR